MNIQDRLLLNITIVLISMLICGNSTAMIWQQEQTSPPDILVQREIEMIQGLRVRLLFDQADVWSLQQLAKFSDDQRATGDLVIEQIKTQMARAMLTNPEQRPAAWEKTRQLGQDFLLRHPSHPRRLLIQTQMALARMAEAKLWSQEYLLNPNDPRLQPLALETYRTVRSELESLQRDATQALAAANSRRAEPSELTADELRSLMANLKFQLAVSNLQRAELFPIDDRANRDDALLMVLKTLDSILASVDDSNDLWWSTQFSRAEAQRLLGQSAEAESALTQLPLKDLPAHKLSELRQQQLELAAAGAQPERHLELIPLYQQVASPSPALDIALMRYLVRLSQAGIAVQGDSWLDKAASLTRRIESRHGTYWGRVAERILIGGAGQVQTSPMPSQTTNKNWEVIVRVGETAVREQRIPDAITAYEQASQLARDGATSAEQWRNVFQIQMKLAEIYEQQKSFDQAARLLTETSRWQPELPASSSLHLRAIWCWAQQAAQSKTDREQYRQSLQQHLEWWPQADSANQARIWSARLATADGDLQAALENYVTVRPQDALALTAAKEFGPVFRSFLQSPKFTADAAKVTERVRTWLVQLQQLEQATGYRDKTTDNWSRRYWLTSRLATGLQYGLISPEVALATLEETISTSLDTVDAPWTYTAQALWVASQSLQGQTAVQVQPALDIIANEIEPLLMIWQIIDSPYVDADARTLPLRRWILDRLIALSSTQYRLGWQLKAIDLRIASQAFGEAENLASELIKVNPQSLDLQLRLARALQGQSDRQSEALGQWRKIAARASEQTDGWFEAKYEVARLLLESGQKAQAKQLLDYMAAIPPGWAKSARRDAFDALLKRCQQ